jgi:Tol biopolymer transport system component
MALSRTHEAEARVNPSRWDTLSDWHNEWLEADAEGRDRLRTELAAVDPGLVADADALTSASGGLSGFLETPAFMLAVPALGAEEASLEPGTMLGPYRISGLLASGGMGDVYRATDVRLDRKVAIKVLTRASEGDPDRRERLLQEARLTAQLDHPNVVRLYDVGISSDRPYLVTELLEGETLRTRLGRGALTIAEVVAIAADIARGLVAAHGAQLVHRDLKPENIFLTRSGVAKVLDFGIAKLKQDATGSNIQETMTGVLLGTAGYLAPEQIRGQPVDARTDLFTLGTIVFEMLHGRRAFAREHTIDTLHAIVHEPPTEPAGARSDVPAALQTIVARLLEKAPADRFQSAGEVLNALDGIDTRSSVAGRSPSRWSKAAIAAAAAVVVAAGAWWIVAHTSLISSLVAPARTGWTLPAGTTLASTPAMSPDGRMVALSVATATGPMLLVKDLSAPEATTIAGTEGATQPFWSPDGKSVGYFARGRLMRVELGGGAPVALAAAQGATGGAWSQTGTIVFGRLLIDAPLARVGVAGGAAAAATVLNNTAGDNSHRFPSFLPDGVHFVYFIRSANDERRGVYLGRLDKPDESRMLFNSDSPAVYVPVSGEAGVLLSERTGRVEAREFDNVTLSLKGDPRFIDVPVGGSTPYQSLMLSASTSVLTAVAAPLPFGDRLVEAQRDGRVLRTWPERELQNWPRVSADGHWLLRQRIDAVRGNPDIWAEHLDLRTRVRVTTGSEDDALAVWSPTGKEVAYVSGQLAIPRLHISAADGSGARRDLSCPGAVCRPTDWTRDGRFLVVNVQDKNSRDVWLIATTPAASSRALLAQAFVERDARVSPDGRWIAYVSEEAGRAEVSVRRIDGTPAREVVSADGGDQPVWRRDGGELFFVDPEGRLMAVRMKTGAEAAPMQGAPAVVPIPRVGFGHFGTQYDVSPDGQRFYLLDRRRDPAPAEILFISGWQRLLRR